MKTIEASIIIPTKNAGKQFKMVLNKIFSQKFKNFELIVIDSGSTDGTLDLIGKHPIRLVKIKPEEFGHGKTRNYGAALAKGKYIVFLTQDSMPQNENWLLNIISPFKDPKIAGVYGRQIPKANENDLDKYFFLSLYGAEDKMWTSGNFSQGDNIFSDANSALRKSLIKSFPYKNDIIVSEDYEWAARMLTSGHKIFYSTKASVIHSHSYNISSLFKRNFDVGVSYKAIYKTDEQVTFLTKGLKIVQRELEIFIQLKKYYLIPAAIFRNIVRFIAINIGKRENLFPKQLKRNYLSAQRWYWV